MNTTSKIAIGVSLASGALLAAWLLTGPRKEKTKKFLTKSTTRIKASLKSGEKVFDDSEIHYV